MIARASAGPYVVSAWTRPDPPRVGALHVTVAVMRPEDGAPVLDAKVRLTAKSMDREGTPASASATAGGGGNRLLHDVDLDLPGEGRWRISLLVEGPAGSGSVAFDVQVEAPWQLTWLLVGTLGGAALVWMAWRGFRRGKRPAPGAEPNTSRSPRAAKGGPGGSE